MVPLGVIIAFKPFALRYEADAVALACAREPGASLRWRRLGDTSFSGAPESLYQLPPAPALARSEDLSADDYGERYARALRATEGGRADAFPPVVANAVRFAAPMTETHMQGARGERLGVTYFDLDPATAA
jgi:hypothetical protein